MIIPLPLIVSLLLAAIQATEFEYKIELDRCGKNTACFIRKTCLEDEKTNNVGDVLVELVDSTKLSSSPDTTIKHYCDVVVQIKAFNDKKFLVLMEVKSDAGKLKPETEFGIYQKNEKQLVCERDKPPTVNSKLEVLDNVGSKPNTKVDGNKLFCSFLVSSTEIIAQIFNLDDLDDEYPSFKYDTTDGEQALKYGVARHDLWEKPYAKRTCDGDKAKTSDSSDDVYELKAVDTTRETIECPAETDLVVKYEGEVKVATAFGCIEKKWKWTAGGDETKQQLGKELQVYCGKKFCTRCTELPESCTEGCKSPEKNVIDGCPTRECTANSKYVIDGDHNATNPIQCKKKKGSNEVSWHLLEGDKDPTPIDKLSCRPFITCKASDLNLKCPKDKKGCIAAEVSGDGLTIKTCKSPNVLYYDSKSHPKDPYPKCKTEDGTWSALNTTLKKDTNLYCAELPGEAKPFTGGNGSSVGVIVGASFGVLAVLGVAGFLVFWFVWRPKQRAAKKIAPPSKGLSSKKSGGGKSAEAPKSKKDKKSSASDPPPDSSKKPSASGKEGSPDPATPADANKPPPSTDIEKLADKNSDPKNPPTPAAANEPPTPV